jgi:hypothetical protein
VTLKVFTTEAMRSELRQPSFWQIRRGDRGYLLHSLPTFLLCTSLRTPLVGARGGAVVKTLRYKPEGRGFDSPWCHWNFSVT